MIRTSLFALIVGLAPVPAWQGAAASAEPASGEPIPGFEEGPVMDRVVAGELTVDPPTLECLGFRWYITGDGNRNASVCVAYREAGNTAWRDAMPILRVHHEVANQDYGPYRTGNLFAGSVMFLKPGTAYEVRLTMDDPDGGAPPEKVLRVSTRSEPQVWKDGPKRHVYPTDAGKGTVPFSLCENRDSPQVVHSAREVVFLCSRILTLLALGSRIKTRSRPSTARSAATASNCSGPVTTQINSTLRS